MGYTPEIVKEVNERLFDPFAGFDKNEKKTDLAIVFGGRSTSGTLARTAWGLFLERNFKRIVVAGGARIFQPEVALALALDRNLEILKSRTLKDIFTRSTEADYMERILLERGILDNDVVVGSREKHADAIVRDVMKLDFESATIIGYAPYVARLIGTFRHQGEERPLVPYPVNVFGLHPKNWHKSSLAKIVVNEARNMDPENPKGYIGKFCVVPDWEEEKRKNATLPAATF